MLLDQRFQAAHDQIHHYAGWSSKNFSSLVFFVVCIASRVSSPFWGSVGVLSSCASSPVWGSIGVLSSFLHREKTFRHSEIMIGKAVSPSSLVRIFYGGYFTLLALWLIIYFSFSLSHLDSRQFLSKLNRFPLTKGQRSKRWSSSLLRWLI